MGAKLDLLVNVVASNRSLDVGLRFDSLVAYDFGRDCMVASLLINPSHCTTIGGTLKAGMLMCLAASLENWHTVSIPGVRFLFPPPRRVIPAGCLGFLAKENVSYKA